MQLLFVLEDWFSCWCLEEALSRRAKARDVFHCLGLYPETELPGSRKKDARVIDSVMTFIAIETHQGKVTALSFADVSPCPLLEEARQL